MKTTKIPLRFHPDGTFRILMISDFHGGKNFSPLLVRGIDALLEHAHPDLVLLGGDQCGATSPDDLYTYLSAVLGPIHRRGLPWAHVYGNHDRESGMSNREQQKVYERFPLCLSEGGPDDVYGCGNYVLPILSADGSRVAYNIFALDSNREISDYIEHFGLSAEEGKQIVLPDCFGYGSCQASPMFSQVKWYFDTSSDMERENGQKIPAILYMHVPIPEYILCARNPEETAFNGAKREEICCGELNSGLFSACLERGDVSGIFCGHEHYCNFDAEYCGITLAYDGAVGYDMSAHDDLRGGRIIDLYEDGRMKTHHVRLMELLGIKAMRNPAFFEGGDKYAVRCRMKHKGGSIL